jgi:hypothetical protein
MKTTLTLALLCAALGGCAVVPLGYDDGYYYRNRYYGDGYRYGDHRYRDWSRDDDRYYRGSLYDRPYYRSYTYHGWDHGK